MWTKTAVHLDATPERAEGWHYAQVWSNGGGPTGYCTEHPPHATEEEARLCYGQWLRDHLTPVSYDNWSDCQYKRPDDLLCGAAAKDGYALPGGMRSVTLCAGHCSEANALEALKLVDAHGRTVPAGDSMGS
jgi:hypothetical protein